MDRSPTRGLLLASLLSGCSPALPRLELPLDPASKSVLIAFLASDGSPPTVNAFDFAEGAPPALSISSAKDGQIFALSYHCSLRAIGVVAGPVALDEGGIGLPAAASAASAQILGNAGGPWLAEPAVPERLKSIRVSGAVPPRCMEFATSERPLRGGFQSAEILGENQMALALDVGFFVLDLPDLSERMSWPQVMPNEWNGAARDTTGGVRFANAAGKIEIIGTDLSRRTLDQAHTGTITRNSQRVRIAVPTSSGAPDELYLAGQSGRIERWDGQGWQLLLSAPAVDHGNADVVWLGPGLAQAVGTIPGELIGLTPNGVTHTRVLERGGQLSRILMHASFGLLLFTADGRLIRPKGGTFGETPLASIGQRSIDAVVSTELGVIAGAYRGGTIAQVDLNPPCVAGAACPELVECPVLLVNLDTIETIVAWKDRYYVFGSDFGDKPSMVTLTPTREIEQCQ
ncbi:MAG: hypothetical protein U1E65_20170 [Myxococcota bacterium]